ncbi:hypothetical protein VWP32_23565, partial [Xanthomonas citri pv. citri]
RLAESLSANPPVTEGVLDTETFGPAIEAAVAAEVAYLAQAVPTGRVAGLGAAPEPVKVEPAQMQKQMADAFVRMGMTEQAASIAATGRGF